MSATNNESNRGSPSIYRPEANAWISKRSSDLDYKGVFALIKIGFLQSSFYEVMWSSLYRESTKKKMSADSEKERKKFIRSSGWQHVKVFCSSTTQLD